MTEPKNLPEFNKTPSIPHPFFSAQNPLNSSIFMNMYTNAFNLPAMNGLPMGFLANPNILAATNHSLIDSMRSPSSLGDESPNHSYSETNQDNISVSDEKYMDLSVHSKEHDSGKRSGTQRNRKRFTPVEHKDEKYLERRRRNNEAAKKSRDARKFREDQLARKVQFMQRENDMLRTQVALLKEEMASMQVYFCKQYEKYLQDRNA